MKFVLSMFMTPTRNILPLAVAAERAGFAMATLSEHVVNVEHPKMPYPYTADGNRRWPEFTEFPDQFVTISAMAAVTTRLPESAESVASDLATVKGSRIGSTNAFVEKRKRVVIAAMADMVTN